MWDFIFNFIGGMFAGAILVMIIHLIQTKRMINKINKAIDEREMEKAYKDHVMEVKAHDKKVKPSCKVWPTYELSDNDYDMHIPKID